MSKQNRDEELLKARFKQLIEHGTNDKPVLTESKVENSTLIEYKKAGDGRIYGIVKENQDYFIKAATPSSIRNPDVTDFVYVNGLENKNDLRFSQLNETQKILNSKLKTINETFGYVEEDEFNPEEEQVAPEGGEEAPMPEPSPEGVPAEDGEVPMPEPSPEGVPAEGVPAEGGEEAPMPEPSPEGVPAEGGEEADPINKAKSHIGKAGNYIKTSEVSSEMTKQLASMFLGYLNMQTLQPEEKQELIDKINNKPVEEDVDIDLIDGDEEIVNEEVAPTPEMIAAILGGVGAVFGLAGGVTALMDYLKKKKPDVAKEIENMGSSAGNSIAGGSRKFNESEEVEDEDSSEEMIKEYAAKYNVSEQVIINTVYKFINEEKKKKDKLLKEDRVRATVRNIIKEKLGLKKKVLKEGTESKVRLHLEKMVDKHLEKVKLNKKK